MNRDELFEQIQRKRSFLCVGLDTDFTKIPEFIVDKLKKNRQTEDHVTLLSIIEFNKQIIDATAQYAVAYKPNLAFYEAYGSPGIAALQETCRHIHREHPNIFIIADAKRGDIGNTSDLYARAFLGGGNRGIFDAVTLSPYMGRDSADAFFKYEDKWAVILALTSNKSADDFETLKLENGGPLWKEVLRKASTWGGEKTLDNTMFVVGATRAETLREVREIVPDHFLLVPGVGAQRGSLAEVAANGMNSKCGLLVNSSRGIIYADSTERFAEAAAEEARKMQTEMAALLDRYL
ncbi:MAG: orotidine-5'-phosphate decarboxylase [Alistipes sp.]|jgi:orotidine-5'-phosphate decarboxylase|nr:orotidine-5'-phosphate decarboxylase [Alistipes sp.]